MELSLVGLQNAGKTSLVNAIAVSVDNMSIDGLVVFLSHSFADVCFHSDRRLYRGFNSNGRLSYSHSYVLPITTLDINSFHFGEQVGFNMRKVTKGNVTIKLWDLGGQRRFRSMWERYCRGVTAIV